MKIELELTDEASAELDRLCEETGLSKAMFIQKAFNLFRVYLETRRNKEKLVIVADGLESMGCIADLRTVVVPGIKEL